MVELSGGRLYRGLVMDYGGVLTTSIAASMAAFCLGTGVSPEQLTRVLGDANRSPSASNDSVLSDLRPGASLGHLIADLETGRLSPEEFEAFLATALSEGLPQPLARVGLIDQLFSTVAIDDRMLQVAHSARGHGIKVAVLSNTWGRSVFHPELLELFDAVVLSEREGLRKPEPEIYLLAARRVGVAPAQCVFVDDMPANVEGARAVGMVGMLHRHPDITIPRLEELFGVSLT